MAVSKAQIQATAKYEAKAYDKTLIRLPKGRLDEIRAHIEPAGESLNGFIGRAITEAMERDRGGGVAGRDAPQEAAGAAQGGRADVVNRDGGAGGPQEAAPTAGGVLLLPPDVLEDIRLMAEAEGEDIPSYVSRAVRAYAMQDGVEDDQEAAGAAQGGGGIPCTT